MTRKRLTQNQYAKLVMWLDHRASNSLESTLSATTQLASSDLEFEISSETVERAVSEFGYSGIIKMDINSKPTGSKKIKDRLTAIEDKIDFLFHELGEIYQQGIAINHDHDLSDL